MNVRRTLRSVINELTVITLMAHICVFVTKVFMEMDSTVQVSHAIGFEQNYNRYSCLVASSVISDIL